MLAISNALTLAMLWQPLLKVRLKILLVLLPSRRSQSPTFQLQDTESSRISAVQLLFPFFARSHRRCCPPKSLSERHRWTWIKLAGMCLQPLHGLARRMGGRCQILTRDSPPTNLCHSQYHLKIRRLGYFKVVYLDLHSIIHSDE
jgi:hypothetical protein